MKTTNDSQPEEGSFAPDTEELETPSSDEADNYSGTGFFSKFVPESRMEEPTADTLASQIEELIADHVVFPSAHEPAMLALWVFHSYVIGQSRTTPYVWVRSAEKGSGKTTLLGVLEKLVLNPCHTSSISAAAMFRIIEKMQPTLLCDEMDVVFGGKMAATEKASELRGVLNSGYKQGGSIFRCVGDSQTVVEFKTFSAKALAGLRTLPDTVSDRCIEVNLRRALPGEQKRSLDYDTLEEETARIRPLLAGFAQEANLPKRETHEVPGLHGRQLELWRPLLVIAEWLGGDWPQKAREAAEALTLKKPHLVEETYQLALLRDMRGVFATQDKQFTQTILEYLRAIEEAPWDGNLYGGQQLDAYLLSKLLREFGIKPTQVRIGTESKKGYERHDFLDAWQRYLRETDESDAA